MKGFSHLMMLLILPVLVENSFLFINLEDFGVVACASPVIRLFISSDEDIARLISPERVG